MQKFDSLSSLLDMKEHEVRVTAVGANCNETEVKSLLNAFKNLKTAYQGRKTKMYTRRKKSNFSRNVSY